MQIFDEYFPILGPCITDFARISDSTCLLCQISAKFCQVLVNVYIGQAGISSLCCFNFLFRRVNPFPHVSGGKLDDNLSSFAILWFAQAMRHCNIRWLHRRIRPVTCNRSLLLVSMIKLEYSNLLNNYISNIYLSYSLYFYPLYKGT